MSAFLMPQSHEALAPSAPRVSVRAFLRPGDLRAALRAEAKVGLSLHPKELSPKWFYDERGSELFDAITRVPEYYPTRREREILLQRAREIAALTRAETLVELGSGTSEKTRILLSALAAEGSLRQFVPFDVSEATLRTAAQDIAEEYPGLTVSAVVGDFERHLGKLPRGSRRLIAFLGGTIGNFKPSARAMFYRELSLQMSPGDSLLLGTDLVKDTARLHAAYNDAQGVTAAFNLNLLSVLNRELGANFQAEHFEHVARFDAEASWIEMLLRSTRAQRVRLPALEMCVDFEEGELMRTEVSTKFRVEQVQEELAAAGLRLAQAWTDPARDFCLSLAVKA